MPQQRVLVLVIKMRNILEATDLNLKGGRYEPINEYSFGSGLTPLKNVQVATTGREEKNLPVFIFYILINSIYF